MGPRELWKLGDRLRQLLKIFPRMTKQSPPHSDLEPVYTPLVGHVEASRVFLLISTALFQCWFSFLTTFLGL